MEIQKTAKWISEHCPVEEAPLLSIVLGSGWGELVASAMEVKQAIPYEEIPGFPVSTVEGHAGQLLYGTIGGAPVYVLQGRFHYYEGYSLQEVTFPIRVLRALGTTGILLTNAAGGIREYFKPGDLMMINDHINQMGANPLRGPNLDELGPRFPDMTDAWDAALSNIITTAGQSLSTKLHKGIYLAVSGPSFETPAEIRAFKSLGADAVGMSTVPECIVARHCGLRVTGISCITNVAAHTGGEELTHEDVSKTAKKSLADITMLIKKAVPGLHQELENPNHVD